MLTNIALRSSKALREWNLSHYVKLTAAAVSLFERI
jgi:hypothetical protein